MVGTDESTELWRPPSTIRNSYLFELFQSDSFVWNQQSICFSVPNSRAGSDMRLCHCQLSQQEEESSCDLGSRRKKIKTKFYRGQVKECHRAMNEDDVSCFVEEGNNGILLNASALTGDVFSVEMSDSVSTLYNFFSQEIYIFLNSKTCTYTIMLKQWLHFMQKYSFYMFIFILRWPCEYCRFQHQNKFYNVDYGKKGLKNLTFGEQII